MNHLIFVVEDEDNIRELIRCTLESFSYRVSSFCDAESMLAGVQAEKPDLILLDIMLPGIDGITALKTLKANTSSACIPVIMLTAKSAETEKVFCLDAGADDYITKPFGILELSARIRAAIRRREKPGSRPKTLEYKDIFFDNDKRCIKVSGVAVQLTLKEYELLFMLMNNRDRVISREELLACVWGFDFAGESRTLDMHIKTLRQKLADNTDNPKYIKTVRGIGYSLV
jgi:two-component system, OmpR family, alkaline phosphatase synthesis response regulator PhoP